MTREVVAEIMARWLTVLMALVAQGMALMSPVCFVRCVAADGQQCIELIGQDCHCCGCASNELLPQVCTVAKCCDHGQEQDDEQEAPAGPQIAGHDCTCSHTPMDSVPQVQSKGLASADQSQFQVCTLTPTRLDFVADVRALNLASLQRRLLRPQESPQLVALATVVLRV